MLFTSFNIIIATTFNSTTTVLIVLIFLQVWSEQVLIFLTAFDSTTFVLLLIGLLLLTGAKDQ